MDTIKIDEIIRSPRKTIALIITADARLVIRSPHHTSSADLQRLIASKQAWIQRKLRAQTTRQAKILPKCFADGERFPYLGQWLTLTISDRARTIRQDGQALLFPQAKLTDPQPALQKWYRRQARRHLAQRVQCYAALHGFQYAAVTITDARTRWGSCGAQNTLNFSWRLMLTPPDVVDYVVIHELCHTRIKNHAKHFWLAVQAIMPDYRRHKQWLADNQDLLAW